MWIRHHFFRTFVTLSVIVAVGMGLPFLQAEGSYPGLEILYHVRSLSMASVGTADGSGMDMTVTNPSLLQSAKGGLLLSVMRYPADIQTEMVEWRIPWGRRTTAVSLRHLGFGTFDERDEEGVKTGQFSASETWMSVSFAQSLFRSLDVGMTGGLFLSRVQDVTATLGVLTAGGVVTLNRYDMRVGISVRNLGVTLNSYTEYGEPVPSSLHVGLTKKLAYLPLELSVDAGWWDKGHRNIVRLGGEFTFPYNLRLRWGTSSNRFDLESNRLWQDMAAGTSLGVGFLTPNLSVDLGIEYRGVGGTVLGVGFSSHP
ncbi:MAG: hypothetical protein V3U24_06260 [Candidatus Neomarinimicrobiota bacterium]